MATVISGFLCPKKELFNVRNQVQANILKAPFFERIVENEMKEKTFRTIDLLFYIRVLDIGSKYYCDICCESFANAFRLPPDNLIFDGITSIEKIDYHSGSDQPFSKKMQHLAERLDNLIADKKYFLLVVFSQNLWREHQISKGKF